MKQCKTCIFYKKEYDEMRQSWDDIIVIGQDYIVKHYCGLYDKGIPASIVNDAKKCEYRIPNE